MLVLGVESSCDESAIAIVSDKREVVFHRVLSQGIHAGTGGVVPEVAAREHLKGLHYLLQDCLDVFPDFGQIHAVVATGGPGLVGALSVGHVLGKTIALTMDKPFFSINHLEGHALSPRFEHPVEFPYLVVLMSGGHCEIFACRSLGDYVPFSDTADDSIGEAFDKVGCLLGLSYPCGAKLERLAEEGDENVYFLPRPFLRSRPRDFSFSGLKTAVVRLLRETQGNFSRADVAASFQAAVRDVVKDRISLAIPWFLENFPRGSHVVAAGGVAANKILRHTLEDVAQSYGLEFFAPSLELCSDNGLMIAWAGVERIKAGVIPHSLLVEVDPRRSLY